MRKQTAERVLWMVLGKWTQTSAEASKIQFLKTLPFFQDLAPWQLKRMTEVIFVSAGPPSGGLYLKPPSSGGLCDGVTTIPSARPSPLPRPAL